MTGRYKADANIRLVMTTPAIISFWISLFVIENTGLTLLIPLHSNHGEGENYSSIDPTKGSNAIDLARLMASVSSR